MHNMQDQDCDAYDGDVVVSSTLVLAPVILTYTHSSGLQDDQF